jgi:2-keto-4-pentenoate hydratase/2-oxohepta-3-ene-1,7-dioic acid hydratase in catechol pathway
MRLVSYLHQENPRQPKLGAIINEAVVDLDAAATWAQGACSLSREDLPSNLLEFIYAGDSIWEYARYVLAEVARVENPLNIRGAKHKPIASAQSSVHLLLPIHPLTLRDAYAFEAHVKTANENRGRKVPEAWYEFPVFYYTNPNAVFGPEEDVPVPRYTQALDYELEIAAVIGKPGMDLGPESAAATIFGFTVLNDWSARDVQRTEMTAGLGPAKGKDFATSLGPCIITVDELADRGTGRPGVYDLSMTARINGVERSRGNFKDIYWSFGEIVSRISQEVQIYPGEVIGSGTVGTGCLLELTKGEGPWLQPGDVVELEIERIGVLRNTITAKRG